MVVRKKSMFGSIIIFFVPFMKRRLMVILRSVYGCCTSGSPMYMIADFVVSGQARADLCVGVITIQGTRPKHNFGLVMSGLLTPNI